MRLMAFAAGILAAFSAQGGTLQAYRWSHRVVVASAPRSDDPALQRQRVLFAGFGAEAKARDLVLVEAVGDNAEARALRHTLGIDEDGFLAVLVGKDGQEKLRSSRPLTAAALFPLIDAMPMRREEMRARGE